MVIVECKNDFKLLLEYYKKENCIIHPFKTDSKKFYYLDDLSFISFYFILSDKYFILPFNLIDTKNLSIEVLKFLETDNVNFVFDRRYIYQHKAFKNTIDIDLLFNLENDELIKEYPYIYTFFSSQTNDIKLIPLSKHLEYIKNTNKKVLEKLISYKNNNETLLTYSRFINILSDIEKNGIYTKDDNLIYSKYNLYTKTNRPSNARNKINFMALNKENNERDFIVSRYKNDGRLMLIDYDSFHLRLLAKKIDYDIPKNQSIHTYLGKRYFNKDELSEDERNQSKIKTFKILYSNEIEKYIHIDYFKKIYTLINSLWTQYNEKEYVESFIFKRKFFTKFENKMKMFNYLIQNYETEHNMIILKKLNLFLKDRKTKLILYNYDSFLFDIHKEDKNIINNIKEIIEDKEFPVTIKFGKNYGDI